MSERPTRVCASCGRSFAWRKRWASCWDQVRYCSDRCRGDRPAQDDPREAAILALLAARAPGASICPSEAARVLDPEGWRDRMEDVRRAARRLVRAGRLVITQRGRPVDPDEARGAIRLRLP